MLGIVSAIGALLRMLPSVAAGAVPTVALPGDTDTMTAAPAPPPPAPPGPPRTYEPHIDRTTFKLGAGEYMRQVTAKRQIVLHFTAGGTAAGAVGSWKGDGRTVATAYVVDQFGTIFECFDPSYWAFALGVRHALSRQAEQGAIQIEIVGWGPLRLRTETSSLCSWPRNWTNRYCGIEETARYVKADYRGEHYFSAFPEVQLEAVAALCRYLCRRFEILPDIPPADFRGVANVPRAAGFRGIVAHENYRKDKWDVGPAWNWDKFGELVKR